MAISLREGVVCFSPWKAAGWSNKKLQAGGQPSSSSEFSPLTRELRGKQLVLRDSRAGSDRKRDRAVHAQASSACVPRSMRWWEKVESPNMIEISSTRELVDSLLDAGDRLVVVDFYSPGCGGCKALHPKICQIAQSNPDVLFLKVDYEVHKSMCYSLNVHVLPFFRFYRGAQGRVCSFSCTNATIKKFKDAMAKHGTAAPGPGPARGLEESEFLKLASIRELQLNLQPVVFSNADDLARNLFGSLAAALQKLTRNPLH